VTTSQPDSAPAAQAAGAEPIPGASRRDHEHDIGGPADCARCQIIRESAHSRAIWDAMRGQDND
jgi:hypothetical protein